MENASKALIIAGAILLAILIISLGILIFGQAQDTVESVNMSEQEKLAFNNKFTPYVGENKRGTEIDTLIQAVRANNQAAAIEGAKDRIIAIYTWHGSDHGADFVNDRTSPPIASLGYTGSSEQGTGFKVSTTTTTTGSTINTSVSVVGSASAKGRHTVRAGYCEGIIRILVINV